MRENTKGHKHRIGTAKLQHEQQMRENQKRQEPTNTQSEHIKHRNICANAFVYKNHKETRRHDTAVNDVRRGGNRSQQKKKKKRPSEKSRVAHYSQQTKTEDEETNNGTRKAE